MTKFDLISGVSTHQIDEYEYVHIMDTFVASEIIAADEFDIIGIVDGDGNVTEEIVAYSMDDTWNSYHMDLGVS